MCKKEKDFKTKKRHNYHVRAIIAGLTFLLMTCLIVTLLSLGLFQGVDSPWFYATVIVFLILNTCVAIFIVNSKVQVDFKKSWLAVMIILPYAGVLLYLLFAQKITTKGLRERRINKINKELVCGYVDTKETINELKEVNPEAAQISTYLARENLAPLYKNTNYNYYRLGQLGFPQIVEDLKKAKKFIFIEYFIIESGLFFDSIYEVLKQKAKEGVDVRMIYDDYGSVAKVSKNFFKHIREDGIKCFPFNRVRPLLDVRQNSRDHRKIIVIDGTFGYTGGCNLADEYINKVKRFGLWRDNIIRLEGEAVNGLTNLFLSNWHMNKDNHEEPHPLDYYYMNNKELHPEVVPGVDGFFQPFGDVPFDGEDAAKNVYLQIINRAKKYIYISTPYLLPDSELITALQVAAKSGVDVRIVTPGIPDKKIVWQVTKSYYGTLLLAGVKIYEYTPGFNHTKMIVADDVMGMTGTANMDYRSLYLNFENVVFMANTKGLLDMKSDLNDMMEDGQFQNLKDYINVPLSKKIIWGILRIFAPLL